MSSMCNAHLAMAAFLLLGACAPATPSTEIVLACQEKTGLASGQAYQDCVKERQAEETLRKQRAAIEENKRNRDYYNMFRR